MGWKLTVKSLQNKPTCNVAMVLKTSHLDAISDLTVHTNLKSLINNINSHELSKCNVCLFHK